MAPEPMMPNHLRVALEQVQDSAGSVRRGACEDLGQLQVGRNHQTIITEALLDATRDQDERVVTSALTSILARDVSNGAVVERLREMSRSSAPCSLHALEVLLKIVKDRDDFKSMVREFLHDDEKRHYVIALTSQLLKRHEGSLVLDAFLFVIPRYESSLEAYDYTFHA